MTATGQKWSLVSIKFWEWMMPLYTFVMTYDGRSYVAQERRSNFTGFTTSWLRDIPVSTFPTLTTALRSELQKKMVFDDSKFTIIPNRKNVWFKQVEIAGQPFITHVVQTTD